MFYLAVRYFTVCLHASASMPNIPGQKVCMVPEKSVESERSLHLLHYRPLLLCDVVVHRLKATHAAPHVLLFCYYNV